MTKCYPFHDGLLTNHTSPSSKMAAAGGGQVRILHSLIRASTLRYVASVCYAVHAMLRCGVVLRGEGACIYLSVITPVLFLATHGADSPTASSSSSYSHSYSFSYSYSMVAAQD